MMQKFVVMAGIICVWFWISTKQMIGSDACKNIRI